VSYSVTLLLKFCAFLSFQFRNFCKCEVPTLPLPIRFLKIIREPYPALGSSSSFKQKTIFPLARATSNSAISFYLSRMNERQSYIKIACWIRTP